MNEPLRRIRVGSGFATMKGISGVRLMRLGKLLGIESAPVSHGERLVSIMGVFTGILLVLLVSHQFVGGQPAALIVASMGASAVLLFAVPHGPLSQPWPVAGGHLVSALIGVACAKLIAPPLLAALVGVTLRSSPEGRYKPQPASALARIRSRRAFSSRSETRLKRTQLLPMLALGRRSLNCSAT